MTVQPSAGHAPSVGLAITAAGAVTQLVGLLLRAGGDPGGARAGAGGAMVAAGLAAVLVGLAWQLFPVVTGLAAGSRRAAGVLIGGAAAVAVVVGAGLGAALVDRQQPASPQPVPSSSVQPAAAAATVQPPAATGATTPGGQSVGGAIAAQGFGSNTPPASLAGGVTFPSGDSRTNGTAEASPWGASPALPITVAPAAATTSTTTITTATR